MFKLTLVFSATSPSFFPSTATLESLSLSSSSSLQHEQSDLLLDDALFTFFADECFFLFVFGDFVAAGVLVRSFLGIVAIIKRNPALPVLKKLNNLISKSL
jgi:hypothetical protein